MLPIDQATVLRLLTATPRRIAKASYGLNDERLRCKPAPDAWSANEVLAHLRACSDVWGRSIIAILTQNRPTLRYVSPRTWIRKTNYTDLTFDASFQAYVDQRKDLLKVLRALPQKDWLRGASVKAAAKFREETILSYAQRMAQHEAGHCDQVERILVLSRTTASLRKSFDTAFRSR
jgi:hypothetical protein